MSISWEGTGRELSRSRDNNLSANSALECTIAVFQAKKPQEEASVFARLENTGQFIPSPENVEYCFELAPGNSFWL